ncbi:DNA replication and repair protein RecF [Hydrogenispora ethanolica]|jgi:DNA replication and repair protein RecF|uniref:DNA replication and repair protein RecF n=1 Tax=Hydrogenispora ethanolica TaxID=1082276 RepID=A0A4R1SA13_HYDET|nr:DNA replication/repair protein RecF [Hydrogenispora ethanolica]TCL76335.1 DNA replication and repair protein RecF [Hydrogenispora ethanolica]
MPLQELTLKNFRNYESLTLEFSPRVNIFFGRNAQGKTNILEAIALLCLGRSFRTRKDEEFIRWQQESCYLKGSFQQQSYSNVIEMGIGSQEKRIKLDGQVVKNQELFGRVPVVLFGPDDLQIAKGGPQHRRDFLDFYLAQIEPNYRWIYYHYHRVLQQRNRLFKVGIRSGDELEIWDEQLIEKGVTVIRYRLNMLAAIRDPVRQAHQDISGHSESLGLQYLSFNNQPIQTWDEAGLREQFRTELKRLRRQEMERQITLTGPHRDDLRLTLGDQVELRNFGSQGQQRTAVLALKLGLIEKIRESRGDYPILLLDDVMAEFDDHRKIQLLSHLFGSTQTILTSTNRDDFPVINQETRLYEVKQGVVNVL